MSNIVIEATERSPYINFDFDSNTYLFKGESYPEDINEFFGEIMDKLEEHLEAQDGAEIKFNFELLYFNSSSAKILMSLFDMLEETAGNGNKVHITWTHDAEDDNMEELGEDFGEDLSDASFEMIAVES